MTKARIKKWKTDRLVLKRKKKSERRKTKLNYRALKQRLTRLLVAQMLKQQNSR